MKRFIVSVGTMLVVFLCSTINSSAENNEFKIAFIRHHDLWIKVDGKEKTTYKRRVYNRAKVVS